MSACNSKTVKRLTGSVILIVLLSLCLTLTTFALAYATVELNVSVATGKIGVKLNDGSTDAIIEETAFAPGMTVSRDFTIQNTSTDEKGIYYKVYFEAVDGALKDIVEVTIQNGDTVLYRGIISELTEENVGAANDILEYGGSRTLTASFHLPEDADIDVQSASLSFDLSVKVVQVTNNPEQKFD